MREEKRHATQEKAVMRETFLDEDRVDHAIRPTRLTEFIGQPALCEKLGIYIESARKRGDALDHVLFYGPPGLGKTTLANIISHEIGKEFHSTSAPVIDRPGDLASMLTTFNEGDVFFIDEIHRLRTVVEEVLYSAMEDYTVDIKVGEGVSAKSFKVPLPKFTLVGATTRAGLLSSPLFNRFGIVERLHYYDLEELKKIVKRSAHMLDIHIEDSATEVIGSRSRGTPRMVNRIIRRVRDYAVVKGGGSITHEVAEEALRMLGIDESGLDGLDKNYLRVILEHYNGGPVGVETLAVSLSEEPETLEDVIEPYLIQCGFVKRTPKGRVATAKAYEYLGVNRESRGTLFEL